MFLVSCDGTITFEADTPLELTREEQQSIAAGVRFLRAVFPDTDKLSDGEIILAAIGDAFVR